MNFDWPAAECAECDEIRGGGRVPFDKNFFRRHIVRTRWNCERRPAVARHLYAKTRHQVQRDFDVGFGNQFADDVDGDVAIQ